ncbi:MAG: TIGR02266 family protein [Deltaproteobacteria bacterium]|nr:TIGR02266 family protein [Deltaproteobacteria bacterium]
MSLQTERRNEPRAPIDLQVEYKRLNTFFYDYTKNISKGGTFIKTDRPLPIGTMFLFRLFVPRLEAPLVLHGEVRWIVSVEAAADAKSEEGSEPGMGIRFVYNDESSRQEVDDRVERLMTETLGPLIAAHLRGNLEP